LKADWTFSRTSIQRTPSRPSSRTASTTYPIWLSSIVMTEPAPRFVFGP
jgi:hypothetical protein